MDVQQLAISARGGGGGSGKWFILRKLPHPTRAIWRKFVSMTLRRDTCWRHVLIAECRTKGKVKRGLHSSVSSNVFPIFTSHTPSIPENKLCKLFILKLAGQPGVARAFALRAEVCHFAPLALLSFLASPSLNPEMNRLPYGEKLLIVELAYQQLWLWKKKSF